MKPLKILGYFFCIFVLLCISYSTYVLWCIHRADSLPEFNPKYLPGEYENNLIPQLSDSNGMKNFLQAVLAFDTTTFQDMPASESRLLDTAVNQKWTHDFSQLDILLTKNKPALDLIKLGSQKNISQVKNNADFDFFAPTPHYLRVLYLGNLLVLQGKKYELNKKYSKAVDNYVTVIKFGQSFQEGNPGVLAKLISIHNESLGYKAIASLMNNIPTQPKSFYINLLDNIHELNKSESSIKTAFEIEQQIDKNLILKLSPNPKQLFGATVSLSYPKYKQGPNFWYKYNVLFHTNRILLNQDNYYKEFFPSLDLPYIQWNKSPWSDKINRLDPVNQYILSNYLDIYPRFLATSKVIYQLTELTIALQSFHSQQNHYPTSLDELKPAILPTIPLDPFTNQYYTYQVNSTGFTLYSPGPDLVDDKAQLLYDPTNGIISNGDILLN